MARTRRHGSRTKKHHAKKHHTRKHKTAKRHHKRGGSLMAVLKKAVLPATLLTANTAFKGNK